jgi:L-arabinokinase
MGGVADYSGSLVLEMPIQGTTLVTLKPSGNPGVCGIESDVHGRREISWPLLRTEFLAATTPAKARAVLKKARTPRWTDYVLGCLWVFCREKNWSPEHSFDVEITSTVPEAMGVSSSAALEIAMLRALSALSGKKFKGTELARLGQQAENQMVGAPCGLMDQLASAYGKPGHLLPILCRPDECGEPVALPQGVIVVGWPSGVKHSVAESPYATARTAAFMARKLVEKKLGQPFTYNSEVPLDWWHAQRNRVTPAQMIGADFLREHGTLEDALSHVVPERVYPVRAALDFPIRENARATETIFLLRALGSTPAPRARREALEIIGAYLFASHRSYSAMGLGSPETDRMVAAVKKLGPDHGFYGARISGGGSGGTVAVLLEESALPELVRLSAKICFRAEGPLDLIR